MSDRQAQRTEWEIAVSKILLGIVRQDPWIEWSNIDLMPLIERANKAEDGDPSPGGSEGGE